MANKKGNPHRDSLLQIASGRSASLLAFEAPRDRSDPLASSTITVGCARHLRARFGEPLPRSGGIREDLFVLLRRDDLLAAIEAGRADVMTAMDLAGRRFDSRRRILQEVMSTAIAATGDRFLILLNSHG